MRKLLLAALAVAISIPGLAAPAAAAPAVQRHHDRHDGRDHHRSGRHDSRHDARNHRRPNVRRPNVRNHRWGHNDWRNYRRSNRRLYARGRWHAPFRYHRFRAGVRLNRSYYGRRYWITNPYLYRLPAIGGYYRYVRHYDDVLLVDIRTGRVIRVYSSFFW